MTVPEAVWEYGYAHPSIVKSLLPNAQSSLSASCRKSEVEAVRLILPVPNLGDAVDIFAPPLAVTVFAEDELSTKVVLLSAPSPCSNNTTEEK